MFLAAVAASFASAGVMVTPGNAFLMPDEEVDFGLYTMLDSRSIEFSITNALSEVRATGEATSEVWKHNDSGQLMFTYRIWNDESSEEGINRVSVTDFGGWSVEAGQDVDNAFGPQKARSVDRTSNGGSIGFGFTEEPIGLGTIDPGESSEIMWLKTDATAYRDGTLSVINGGVDSVLSFAPVPEPTSMAVLAIGAVAMLRRRSRKA